jgi:hypothetical protein
MINSLCQYYIRHFPVHEVYFIDDVSGTDSNPVVRLLGVILQIYLLLKFYV